MSSLEAKIVVLGSQGVGKTSLVMRYCKGAFNPSQIVSTVGASFMTKRVVDTDTDTIVRLQIWDTAGQERFRSISRLYYRGANACILCYSITDASSFDEMGIWLTELRRNLPPDIIIHVVGTKADIVARDPSVRQVPFDRVIAYVAENLAGPAGGASSSTPPATTATPRHSGLLLGGEARQSTGTLFGLGGGSGSGIIGGVVEPKSPSSKRSSGFWAMDAGWDACHEVSAESGEGVEEVFRVVTRKLVEQHRQQQALAIATSPGSLYTHPGPGTEAQSSGYGYGAQGYFDETVQARMANGSFRVGRDRKSWLFNTGFQSPIQGQPGVDIEGPGEEGVERERRKGSKCC